jgi:PAS domain S-box-containing protein
MTDDVPVLDFKRLFESAPGLSLVLLPDQPRFTIVAVSDQYLKAAGKQRSDLLGRGLFEAFAGAPESPGNPLAAGVQNLRDSLLRALSSRAPDSLAPAPAVVRPGSFLTTAVHGNDGQIVSLIHTLAGGVPDPWDGEEHHRLIVELANNQAMYLLDRAGHVLSWSRGAQQLYGYMPSEIIGRSFSTFSAVSDVESGKPLRDLRLAEVDGKCDRETLRIRKDGSSFWASAILSAIHDEAGHLKGFSEVVSDISRQRNDAQALEDAKALLESRVKERTEDLLRSNNELEQFAYIASHDLQTPLRHISSYVQLLTTKIRKTVVLDAKSEKWITYILSGTLQMKSLISDLLAYSRVGRVDIAVEEIDTSSLIVNVLNELREPLSSSNGKVVCGELPQISGIRSQIDQLFQNLIENALKFRRPETDPLVNITCDSQGELWRFSVADNGIGIDPKYSERIFLMFHRLHSSSEYPGTGIGLAICKKIVEFHGGKIELDTAASGGATFHFSLPKRQRITSMAHDVGSLQPLV